MQEAFNRTSGAII